MKIRTAVISDLPKMLEMTSQASARIAKMGFDQWQHGYPDEETLRQDIADKNAYIAEIDGEPAGMMALTFTDLDCYEKIEGKWIDNGFYCAVHRLCVADGFEKRGVAMALFAAAEMIASERGFGSVRVDTHEQNAPMRHTLEKCGYTHCGRITLIGSAEDGHKREAYQKVLK